LNELAHPAGKQMASLAGAAQPSLRGVLFAEPGHLYSPLLNIESASDQGLPNDDAVMWKSVDLRVDEQRVLYVLVQLRIAWLSGYETIAGQVC